MHTKNAEQIKLGRENKGLTKRFNSGLTQTIYRNKFYTLETGFLNDNERLIFVRELYRPATEKQLYGFYINNTAYRKSF